jgi:glycosyltransferase involved in cell wall biosynthesis
MAELRELDVRLVLAGEGETRRELEQLARDLGLAERVGFLGTVPHEDIARYFAAADVVLATSEASETFGMALAEAMACERPVLASTWVGFDDVVIEGETGARFPSQDAAGLARALRALLGDQALRARYGAQGRRHVHQHFKWAQVEARVQAVYEEVHRSRARPS